MKKYVVILAGGRGTRINAGMNKIWISLNGKTILERSMEAFSGLIDGMIIVCRPEEEEAVRAISAKHSEFSVCYAYGGATRQDSVRNGLRSMHFDEDDLILIHDAARCLVDQSLICRVIQGVLEYGACVPGIPATSTFKRCDQNGFSLETPDRNSLYEIQTPQGFKAGIIVPVSEKAFSDHISGTDDASLAEYYGIPVKITEGSGANLKITSPKDLLYAEAMLEGGAYQMRVGMGYDVHRLVENRKLILCGVDIPYEFGLLGHSDADVALHALMDAMLGACSLGDIGRHFPDSDKQFKGISSLILLKKTSQLINEANYQLGNIDITIVAQKPKLSPFVSQMIHNVASALNMPENRISIKATTTEKLGFEGREEGISAYAICTVTATE